MTRTKTTRTIIVSLLMFAIVFCGFAGLGAITASAAEDTYTITYRTYNGVYTLEDYSYGDTITPPPDPLREGYTFTGWDKEIPATMPAEDLTITATWGCTVSFDVGGGTINSGDITVYVCGVGATLPTDVTKKGFAFGGWYDNPDFTGESVTEIAADADGDKTYYAKWERLEYYDPKEQKLVHEETATATVLKSTMTAWGTSDTETWYYASDDVTIDSRVTVNGTVNLILADGCMLTVNGGIKVPSGASLTIYGQSNQTGKLIAKASNPYEGAGIGGSYRDSVGTITINGGIIEASSSDTLNMGGAGIGGGARNTSGGVVIINNGIVSATNPSGGGSGIGPGIWGDSITVEINGGTIYAAALKGDISSYQGTGISGTVTITGGVITANSMSAATINRGIISTDNGSTYTIYSDADFTDDFTNSGTITIANGQTLTVAEGITLTNSGTIVIEEGGKLVVNGALINNGTIANNGEITGNGTLGGTGAIAIDISKGAITITETGYTANGASEETAYTGDYIITGTVSGQGYGVTVKSGTHNITINDLNVDTTNSQYDPAFGIEYGASVNLTLTGTNVLKSGYCSAGLQVPSGATLVITEESTGTLDATGGQSGAGIGGNYQATSGDITIHGGTVTATGGQGAAGIGGGQNGGSGGNTTITGGVVTANGKYGGAGIGSGLGGYSAGNIVISGGLVTVTGEYDVGIGGDNGIYTEDKGTFSSTASGSAVIYTNNVYSDTTGFTSGILFVGDEGKVYGTIVTPTENFELPSGKTLTIASGQTLTVAEGINLTNNGTIVIEEGGALFVNGELINNGTIINNGMITNDGTITNNGEFTVNGTLNGDGNVRNKVTISFDANTGTGEIESVTAYTTDTYTLPECTFTAPIRHEFKAWSVGGTEYAVGASFTVTADTTTVTAVWKPQIYSVDYAVYEGTINDPVTEYTYGVGATLPTDVTKEGFTFGGWYQTNNFSDEQVSAIGSEEYGSKYYYAKWIADINYETNGGTINGEYATEYLLNLHTYFPADVTKTGYTFGGWYDNEACVGNAVTVLIPGSSPAETYYAKWIANIYTIDFELYGGNINSLDVRQYTYGIGAILPTDVTKTGYTFSGWYADSDFSGDAVTEITATDIEDKTFYAKWISHTELIAELEKDIKELNKLIEEKADTATLNAKVAELNAAIATAENIAKAYADTQDSALKQELESKITSAQTTLQTAITALSDELDSVKQALEAKNAELAKADADNKAALEAKDNELANKDAELENKDNELQTFIIIVCVISGVALCGSGAFVVWFFIDRKKRI